MKKVLLAVLLFLPLVGFAGVQDTLMQQFVDAYKAQRAKDHNYVKAMFAATEKTIQIKNPTAKKALCALNKPDTTAIKLLTSAIISRFIDEDLLRTECSDDYETSKDLIQFYSGLMCTCLTEKNNTIKKDGRKASPVSYMTFVEKCRDEINEDTAVVNKVRSMVSDMSRINEVSHCIIPCLQVKCPLVRNDFSNTCIQIALAAYQTEQEDQEKRWKESLIKYLMSEPAGNMDAYYANAELCKKIRQELYIPARRLATLNTTHEQLYFTSEFTNNKRMVTFVYSGRKPEVICQVEFEKTWLNFQYTITSVRTILPAAIKHKDIYIMEAMQETAPPMKKLK